MYIIINIAGGTIQFVVSYKPSVFINFFKCFSTRFPPKVRINVVHRKKKMSPGDS